MVAAISGAAPAEDQLAALDDGAARGAERVIVDVWGEAKLAGREGALRDSCCQLARPEVCPPCAKRKKDIISRS